jgi:hypothetical protein
MQMRFFGFLGSSSSSGVYTISGAAIDLATNDGASTRNDIANKENRPKILDE